MRRLLYIPIIHDEADMGTAGVALAQVSAGLAGERRWALHQQTIGKFWDSVATHLRSFDPNLLKIYQDGLPADGQVGRRIVEEAAGSGSKNYQLILDLLDRGAELRKTEDPLLLWHERENLRGLAQQESAVEQPGQAEEYRLRRDWLLEERDRFIAATINATLKVGELGVLFIGAYHNVASRLPEDIIIECAKDPRQVGAYLEEALLGQNDKRLGELVQYLISPVAIA